MRPSPKAVNVSCEEYLKKIGFSRSSAGICFKEIDSDFLGWIGLNRGTHENFIRINPFVGLHVIPVQKLMDDLDEKKYIRGAAATTSVHLGDIAPDIFEFKFASIDDLDSEALRLARAVESYALPWFYESANYQWLINALESELWKLGGVPKAYAAARYINGDVDGALSYVLSAVDQFSRDGSGYFEYFLPFSKQFILLCEAA